jgi:hypothetical protein
MKKLLFIVTLFFLMVKLFGQSQGISYQAVIIDQNAQEIAGVDISGNIIPNRAIMVRFTILDAAGTIDYQEEQAATTDAYGMINLVISKGTPTASSPHLFKEIDWDGTSRSLKVDISLSQTSVFYTDFSLQELNFVPYAYHKNITATGSLDVNGKSTLQDLTVKATTNLNGSLDVNNSSPSHLSGTLTVDQTTTLGNTLTVNAASNLNGQVSIIGGAKGSKSLDESYPLLVKGSNQGIAIKIEESRSKSNNFLRFYDEDGVQGQIEGESYEDVYTDPKYYFDNVNNIIHLGVAIKDLVASTSSSTVCVGIGACVTSPVPSLIASAAANVVVATAQVAAYNYFRYENAGVIYATKGADYAEWLPKANRKDHFVPGDIVGIKGGYVTFSTDSAEMVMVVSQRPTVLGNTPPEGQEANYVKVAFIGQVTTKVLGSVKPDDYIVPSGKNDGTGIAVSFNDIQSGLYPKVVGIAWSGSGEFQSGYVNVAVGLNIGAVTRLGLKQEQKIQEQDAEIKTLKKQISDINTALTKLVPGYTSSVQYAGTNVKTSSVAVSDSVSETKNGLKRSAVVGSESVSQTSSGTKTVVYVGISEAQILEGINAARQMMQEKGIDVSNHPFFKKINNDKEYTDKFIKEMISAVKKESDANAEKDLKSGASVIKEY